MSDFKIEPWIKGEPVPYAALARALQQVSTTRARLEHVRVMREFFRMVIELTPMDLVTCIYLSSNSLAPPYTGIELGIGESLIQKAIADATGKSLRTIQKSYADLGDLGLVACASMSNVRTLVKPKPLTVRRVHQLFLEIANESGHSSQKRRVDKVRSMIVQAPDSSVNFIVKALQGKMRINMGLKTVITAVGHAFALAEKKKGKPSPEQLLEAANRLDFTYNQMPNWEKIISVALEDGIENLESKVSLTLGIPFAPMLAHPTKGISEIFDRFKGKTFTAEWKYDGERTQIHCLEDGTIEVYSKRLDNSTEKFPDVVIGIKLAKNDNTKSFILDCEAVAFNKETQKILPFQILSTRSRKSVKLEDIKVNVCLFAFDIMYLNGSVLIQEPLIQRRAKLQQHFHEVDGFFKFATHKDLTEPDEIIPFLNEAVDGHCEGLMLKTLEVDANYQAAKRTYQWLKVKKDYLDGMGDTLDLVPIGAFLGKGKRTGVYGGFLLAVYDDDAECFQSICKIGSGFTDVELVEFTEQLKKTQIEKPKSYFRFSDSKNVCPDVWFEPSVVWEVKAADLSISPVHQAGIGLVSNSKGIALRFPRLVRIRPDKAPEQATSAQQIAEMYRNQKISHPLKEDGDDD